jgi:integrase
MVAEEYLSRSRLFRHLKSGPHGQLVDLYAARLAKDGLARHGTWRRLSLVSDLLSWIASSRSKLTDLDERIVERYLRHRARKYSIQPGDRATLKRFLSVLRDAGTIAPAALLPIAPQDRIFEEFVCEGNAVWRRSPSSVRHQPFIRRFLREVCPAGAGDLGRISQEDVTRYIERHARDWSAESGKAMCWSLRAFLRYLHHRGLNPLALAGCVPSIRRWKLASLPTYLSAAQQGLGYKYQHQARRLADFVSFMERRKVTTITTKLALAWSTLPPGRHASWALRLTDVRGFARHVANIDPQTEVPPAGILPRLKRAKPYVYSDAEIEALLAEALALPPAGGLRRWTYHYLFGLIAVTGMRLSEAIGLQRDDVDLDGGVLTVRQSKFGKSRLVPLHPTTRAVLRSYAERRDAHLGLRCGPYFFVAECGGRLLHQYVHRVFWRLSRETGLRRPGDHTGPRVHDFRHRFAIRTLLGWYREGIDVEQQLPALSTYLGHACVRDTYWYLSACPELMQEAALRLDLRWEAKP